MLSQLVVEGLGVIERAETELGPGSVSLTGETGAGKTLVVTALSLLLGGRADRSLIRSGRSEARVEGLFVLPREHPVVRFLADQDLVDGSGSDDVEILISRTVGGRASASKARINGRLVTAALLSNLSGRLVEIAGQHEHQRLGDPSFQRSLLDSFAGADVTGLAERLKTAVRQAAALEKRAEELEAGERSRLREMDSLTSEIDQIEQAELLPGERDRLEEEARRLEFAATLAGGIEDCLTRLRGEAGTEETLADAEALVRGMVEHDSAMSGLADRLEAARYEVADIADELRGRSVIPDPDALEAIRSRLDQIAKLRRRFGDTEEEILGHLHTCRDKLGELGSMSASIDPLRQEASAARANAEGLGRQLTAARRDAAPRLTAAVQERMASLALPDALFRVDLTEQELNEAGGERVAFLLAANPGEPARPLSKVASGGELSRLALALHLASAEGAVPVPTMVFDEVDAGVGGAAARAVGRALADLARTTSSQVVVVTHLPQVAAFADVHLRIEKSSEGESTRAVVSVVEGDERVLELSRMLAGLPGSTNAQEHARELLDLAASEIPVA